MFKGIYCKGWSHIHWPALSGGDGEERQEGPENIIIVELVLLPFSGLSCHIILVVVQKMTPERDGRRERIK